MTKLEASEAQSREYLKGMLNVRDADYARYFSEYERKYNIDETPVKDMVR